MMKTVEILKKAFDLNEIEEVEYVEGIFSGKAKKYFIPEQNLKNIVQAYPFMQNAVKAGLIVKDKKSGKYFTTDRILSIRSDDKKNSKKRQFFSINGDDAHERTTLYDGLVTLNNLKFVSKKFGVNSDQIKFTIRYENGNMDKVVNYIELDKKHFGRNDEEVNDNVNKLNQLVQYSRPTLNQEAVNG